jgi:diacylglycerol kinase (ATP)
LLNKPKYHLIKNTQYALDGLKDISKNETSFKVEIFLFIFVSLIILFIDFGFSYVSKAILFLSMFLPLLAESINTSIERVVDLITLETKPMAKRAKDMGSFVVFLSFVFMAFIWSSVFGYEFLYR